MQQTDFFTVKDLNTPLIALALHDGHFIDASLREFLLLDEQARAREEDPYTGYMIAELPVSTLVVHTSRFQLDLNRTKDKAIYLAPEDAWGLRVWQDLPDSLREQQYEQYDYFYQCVFDLIAAAIRQYGYFVVLDVHSYNHRRQSPLLQADTATHPEINLGTAYNHESWTSLCQHFNNFLSGNSVFARKVDSRQNIIFKGGACARQIIEKYGHYGPVFSIEFKKTFMDEWTGVADITQVNKLQRLLELSVSFLHKQIVSSHL